MPEPSPTPTDSPAAPASGTQPEVHADVFVLIAHGSRVAAANDANRDLAEALHTRLGRPVIPAFLELAEPSIPDALDGAADLVGPIASRAGRPTVGVLPLFLLPGAHTTRDIPAHVADAVTRHPNVTFTQFAPVGAHPMLIDVLVASVAPTSD